MDASIAPPSPIDETLTNNPALRKEICRSFDCGQRYARLRMNRHRDEIEAAADWLDNHVRIGDGPGVDAGAARQAYRCATGAAIGILEFITAALLAGYPATIQKRETRTQADPTVRKRAFFCFHFNPADVAAIAALGAPGPAPTDGNSDDDSRRSPN